MNSLLCIISKAPYADSHTLELVEAAMVAAVFDLDVKLLFRDDGVWSLLKDQDASPLGRRTLSKVLSALPTYDVERIFVCLDSAKSRQLSGDDFCLPVQMLSMQEQAELIGAEDCVMGAQA